MVIQPEAGACATLLLERFFTRHDRVAVLGRRGSPEPRDTHGLLEDLLLAHLLGPCASDPDLQSLVADLGGRFRVGSYAPAPDGTTSWLCLDFDGAGHSTPLADPLAAALTALDSLWRLGIAGYLEQSGSGHGWHVWVFFDAPIRAKDARALGFAIAPRKAPLANSPSQVADPSAGRGIEVFPKSDRVGAGGVGTMVWLPWWHGAPKGANQFYQWRQS